MKAQIEDMKKRNLSSRQVVRMENKALSDKIQGDKQEGVYEEYSKFISMPSTETDTDGI